MLLPQQLKCKHNCFVFNYFVAYFWQQSNCQCYLNGQYPRLVGQSLENSINRRKPTRPGYHRVNRILAVMDV